MTYLSVLSLANTDRWVKKWKFSSICQRMLLKIIKKLTFSVLIGSSINTKRWVIFFILVAFVGECYWKKKKLVAFVSECYWKLKKRLTCQCWWRTQSTLKVSLKKKFSSIRQWMLLKIKKNTYLFVLIGSSINTKVEVKKKDLVAFTDKCYWRLKKWLPFSVDGGPNQH